MRNYDAIQIIDNPIFNIEIRSADFPFHFSIKFLEQGALLYEEKGLSYEYSAKFIRVKSLALLQNSDYTLQDIDLYL